MCGLGMRLWRWKLVSVVDCNFLLALLHRCPSELLGCAFQGIWYIQRCTGTSCDDGYGASRFGVDRFGEFPTVWCKDSLPVIAEFIQILRTDWLITMCGSSETCPCAFGGLQPRDQHDRSGDRAAFFAGSSRILVSGLPEISAVVSCQFLHHAD